MPAEPLPNLKIQKKKSEEPRQLLLDRLTVKQTEPGMAFIVKQSGNGGACVSLARQKSTDQKKIVFGARDSSATDQVCGL